VVHHPVKIDRERLIEELRECVRRAAFDGGVVHMTTEVVNVIIEALEDETPDKAMPKEDVTPTGRAGQCPAPTGQND
jgi:hypothetical protein